MYRQASGRPPDLLSRVIDQVWEADPHAVPVYPQDSRGLQHPVLSEPRHVRLPTLSGGSDVTGLLSAVLCYRFKNKTAKNIRTNRQTKKNTPKPEKQKTIKPPPHPPRISYKH